MSAPEVAFVVQRYGAEVAGGAEALCRGTAHALAAAGARVSVYTTTARDAPGWEPRFPPGEEWDGAVRVRRFPAERPDPARAGALLRRLALAAGAGGEVAGAAEAAWARAQGPVSRPLRAALAAAAPGQDAVAFWTYLYATTQLGLPLVDARSVLVPCAPDEPMLRFALTRGLVRSAGALAFLTPEEERLVDDLHGVGDTPTAVVGTGLDPPLAGDAARARRAHALPARLALYLGRVDAAKGVDALVRAHAGYRAAGGTLGLVLAGRGSAGLRLPAWVVTTGFVSAAERADLLSAAEVVVLPSPLESLSLAALEAWQAGRPTLATTRSEVLAAQSARAGGGLLYSGPRSYAAQLARLASDPELRELLGAGGHRFTAPLTWAACAERWRSLLSAPRAPGSAPSARAGPGAPSW